MTFNAKEVSETIIGVIKSGGHSFKEDEEFIAHMLMRAHSAGVAEGWRRRHWNLKEMNVLL